MERYGEQQLDQLALELEASDQFRVLRRLTPRPVINPPDGSQTRVGVFVDVETTGLDSSNDEVIELAMVPFTFGLDGRIFEVQKPFQQLSEPKRSLSEEVQQLTGLTKSKLAGQRIDLFEVGDFASQADLVVAHHAQFDRPFLERLSPVFQQKPWACSMSQIGWRGFGYESTKLDYLAFKCGFFFDGHRAAFDCFAGIELLASGVGESTGMAHLLSGALSTGWRIAVAGSPFEANAELRERGYKWVPKGAMAKRCWEIEVDDGGKNGELEFLSHARFKSAAVQVDRVSPFERFSLR